jgi:hypothetical protein
MISLAFSAFLIAAPAVVVDTAAAVPAKPATRLLQRSLTDGLSAAIRISPGVPDAGKVIRVIIEISKSGVAGSLPLNGAQLLALIEPNTKATKDRKIRRSLARVKPMGRKVQAFKDRGSYGFHLTLPVAGSYRVTIEGSLKGKAIGFEFGLYPELWPAPDLQDEAALIQTGRSRRPLRRR